MEHEQNQNHELPDAQQASGEQIRSGDYAPASGPQGAAKHGKRRGRGYKSSTAAGWLSLVPGLGQIYIGYYQRGFLHAVVVITLITALASGSGTLAPMLGTFLAFFWLYNIIDASRRASLINRAIDGLGDTELPEDFEMPGAKGTQGMGILLVVLGVLILLNTGFDVSMEWLEDWWPLAMIGGGVYLIMKNRNKD